VSRKKCTQCIFLDPPETPQNGMTEYALRHWPKPGPVSSMKSVCIFSPRVTFEDMQLAGSNPGLIHEGGLSVGVPRTAWSTFFETFRCPETRKINMCPRSHIFRLLVRFGDLGFLDGMRSTPRFVSCRQRCGRSSGERTIGKSASGPHAWGSVRGSALPHRCFPRRSRGPGSPRPQPP